MSKIKLGGDTFGVTFHLWTTTSYSQSKSHILVKQTDWWYILGYPKTNQLGNQVRHILIILSILLLSSPLFGQETGVLYQYKTSSGIKWETFGNEKVQPKYEGKTTNMKPTRLSSIHDVGKSSFWLFYNLIFYLRHFRPFFLVQ